LQLALTLALFGIRFRYWAVAVVILVLLLLALMLLARSRGTTVAVTPLQGPEAQRYITEFDALEQRFVDNPQQAAARARGLTEEVMRRAGFPDRVDQREKIRDLKRHDGTAAGSLEAAERALRQDGNDTEGLRQAVKSYRSVIEHLVRPS